MKKDCIVGVSPGSSAAGFAGSLQRRTGALIFAAAALVTSVFFIDFCAAVFRCGCVSLWSGADAHCNIHMAGGRHCPWCEHGLVASAIPWALIVAVQAGVSFWPRPMSSGLRLASAVVAFPAAGAVIAVAYGISAGYWK
jgi:hypothetical protein